MIRHRDELAGELRAERIKQELKREREDGFRFAEQRAEDRARALASEVGQMREAPQGGFQDSSLEHSGPSTRIHPGGNQKSIFEPL